MSDKDSKEKLQEVLKNSRLYKDILKKVGEGTRLDIDEIEFLNDNKQVFGKAELIRLNRTKNSHTEEEKRIFQHLRDLNIKI